MCLLVGKIWVKITLKCQVLHTGAKIDTLTMEPDSAITMVTDLISTLKDHPEVTAVLVPRQAAVVMDLDVAMIEEIVVTRTQTEAVMTG